MHRAGTGRTPPHAAPLPGVPGGDAPRLARAGHGQVHERVDVECEVAGRYTTSKRELASQYSDIYYYRLHKVRLPRENPPSDEKPRRAG